MNFDDRAIVVKYRGSTFSRIWRANDYWDNSDFLQRPLNQSIKVGRNDNFDESRLN